jgi:hypothetical protein
MNRSLAYRLFRACRPRPYLLIALLPVVASAKYGYKLLIPEAAAQGVLPSEGPAAARLNPASLADVGLASAAYGHYGSMSGKSGIGFVQLALGMPGEFLPLPVGLAAGFGYMYQDLGVDGRNATYEETEYDPGLSIRLPADPETPWHLEAGLTFAIHEYNAFNAVESYSLGIDVGMLYSVRVSPGLFGLGFAYHGLKSPHIRLPDENGGYYRIPGWMEPSFAWTSATRRLRVQMSLWEHRGFGSGLLAKLAYRIIPPVLAGTGA